MLKSRITQRADEGMKDSFTKWQEYAEANGHFKKKNQHAPGQPSLQAGDLPSPMRNANQPGKEDEDEQVMVQSFESPNDNIVNEEFKSVNTSRMSKRTTKRLGAIDGHLQQGELPSEQKAAGHLAHLPPLQSSAFASMAFVLVLLLLFTQLFLTQRQNDKMDAVLDTLIQNQQNLQVQILNMNA